MVKFNRTEFLLLILIALQLEMLIEKIIEKFF